jgi:phosphoribosylaminoimidazolecarboxamide formyltransferase/IMP cyclohydrolase
MQDAIQIKRALLSVSDKSGIVEFATALVDHGIELISTGGTAKVLKNAGLSVIDVSSLTGYPEMLDGRVKTLHPVVHGGLLGIRDEPSHITAMETHSIDPIDLICIGLYPFETTAAQSDATHDEIIEQIDIGGPAMIRSGAKNHAFVTVITRPEQYDSLLQELNTNDGSTSYDLRREFALEAFKRTARYDHAIYAWMQGSTGSFPATLQLNCELEQLLRYGENPDQPAAMYKDSDFHGPTIVTANAVAGKPLSYNNMMDAAAALELVQDLFGSMQRPSAAIIKHANPCGAAVADSLIDAFTKAWKCDTLASFGGIVSLSGHVNQLLADVITEGEKFLEVIVAQSFSEDAIAILSKRWKNIRLMAIGEEPRQKVWQQYRSVEGGILVQELRPIEPDSSRWEHLAGPVPTESQLEDASIAWITSGHLKSNAISIVDQGALIGGGMGQVDRLSAAKLAVERAGSRLESAKSPVAGSDAFFPFADGPKLLIDAGVQCIVQPGGSVRDQETIDLCAERNITLLHTGTRRFRH